MTDRYSVLDANLLPKAQDSSGRRAMSASGRDSSSTLEYCTFLLPSYLAVAAGEARDRLLVAGAVVGEEVLMSRSERVVEVAAAVGRLLRAGEGAAGRKQREAEEGVAVGEGVVVEEECKRGKGEVEDEEGW